MTRAAFLLMITIAAVVLSSPRQGYTLQPDQAAASQVTPFQTSPVQLDGDVLFRVRGVEAYPAPDRARKVSELLESIARDRSLRPEAITTVESEHTTDIVAGDQAIMSVFDADARPEGVARQALATIHVVKIRQAIERYRQDRAPREIWLGMLWSASATLVFLVTLLLVRRLYRKVQERVIETWLAYSLSSIRIQSFVIVKAEQIKALVSGLVRMLRLAVILVLAYLYLHLVLGFFPWTRALSYQLLDFLLGPLTTMGKATLDHAPNLIFIAVLIFVASYLLKLMRLFFDGLESGTIAFSGFYPEWARPTFKIASCLLIGFMAVVAFPYIPGSDSPAFKGVSIFLGVILSLGSSSVISNVLAGYTMVYRRAFKVGDRVKIGDFRGDVTAMRLLETHLRTPKNEEIVVPNSIILNSPVINYSTLSQERGLILHTAVTVGYGTPWRQVHALLLQAAGRTQGVMASPPPFVRQTRLDEFYVHYELNAYTSSPHGMMRIYSDLHQNIQDAFNEYGVQIMSPRYAFDPRSRAVVPREHWYEPPAQPPETGEPEQPR